METVIDYLQDRQRAERLVGAFFDFCMGQPLSRFISPDQVIAQLEAALHPTHVARLVQIHLPALMAREQARAQERRDRLDDYLTGEAREALQSLASRPVELDPVFLEGLVRQEAVRHLVRSVVQEAIHRFIEMLRPGNRNGLGAQLFKGPGMAFFGRMAEQMESQVQRAAGLFVSSSLELLLGRLVHILSTPETAEHLGRLRATGLETALGSSTRSLWSMAAGLPIQELLELLPGVIAHNLARTEIREAILEEAEAFLRVEGERPLEALLEPSAMAALRRSMVKVGGSLLADFASKGDGNG